MEAINKVFQSEEAMSMDEINSMSETSIKEEYLAAAIHGPRWILGLIDKAI